MRDNYVLILYNILECSIFSSDYIKKSILKKKLNRKW